MNVMKIIRMINFYVFSRGLSVFDFFWISIVTSLLSVSGWYALLYVPLIALSMTFSEMVEEAREEEEEEENAKQVY